MLPRETGLAYRRWVQQVHLADALGYASPSAFSAMFRRPLGAAPQRYLREHGAVR